MAVVRVKRQWICLGIFFISTCSASEVTLVCPLLGVNLFYEINRCFCRTPPLFMLPREGLQPILPGSGVIAGVAITRLNTMSTAFGTLATDFILKVYSQRFSYDWVWSQSNRGLKSVLDGLTSQGKKFHLWIIFIIFS